MKLLAALAVALVALQAFADEWFTNPANGHMYTAWYIGLSGWQGAEDRAVSLGGHLATVNDLAENQWIRTTFSANPNYTNDYCLIGLYETDYVNHTWAWSSGEPLDFQYWGQGEPKNDPMAHWGAISEVGTPPGAWAALSGSESAPRWTGFNTIAVVEVVPEPTTLAVVGIALMGLFIRRRHT